MKLRHIGLSKEETSKVLNVVFLREGVSLMA